MRNIDLATDYIKRCGARSEALKTLYEQKSWPDVVSESQEVVELALIPSWYGFTFGREDWLPRCLDAIKL